ncbi:MAG TPA: rhamnulokinase [Bacillota bacterium]|nr:rhamnulokinase [Bacillota bacterium]
MLRLLAFDYGASSGRAVLGRFDGFKLETEEVHRFLNQPVLLPNGFHWDILRLYHELKQGIIQCIQQGHGNLNGLGIDTWGVDFGLLDSKGVLLGNPYHYRDHRTEGMIERATRQISREEIYRITGIAFQQFNTLYQIMAMQEHQPTLLDQADRLLFIPDLLNYFLTGEKYCEYTIASTSQMLDIQKGNWAQGMLERLGLPTAILGELVQPCRVLGDIRPELLEELNLQALPVISVAEHDTASAVAAVPVVEKDFVYLSSGTWSLMGVETSNRVIREKMFRYNFTNEGGVNQTVRLLKNIMGLWIYQECIREWRQAGDSIEFADLEKLAEMAVPFSSIINPDDPVFFTPGGMTEKIRDYCRTTRQSVPGGKGAIVRCILESLALCYRKVLQELEEITGIELPVIQIVGGGVKNNLLNRFTADATGRRVLAGPVEATAIGNLLCQLIALGELKDLKEARELVRASFPVREYLPEKSAGWESAYERFLLISQQRVF